MLNLAREPGKRATACRQSRGALCGTVLLVWLLQQQLSHVTSQTGTHSSMGPQLVHRLGLVE